MRGGKQRAAGGSIQAGVAHDRGVAGNELAAPGGPQHNLAAGHALADVVVCVTGQSQLQAANIPAAETLPRGAGKIEFHRGIAHTLVAVQTGNLSGQPAANGAVGVVNAKTEFPAAQFTDAGADFAHDAGGKTPGVERWIALAGAVPLHRVAQPVIGHQP